MVSSVLFMVFSECNSGLQVFVCFTQVPSLVVFIR